jgi:hypothetical protein
VRREPFVSPVKPGGGAGLGEHRLNEFIPGGVPFSDFLQRQNFIARSTEPARALWPEGGPAKDRAGGRSADSAQGGRSSEAWPRLGDVTQAETTIERRVRVVYRVEQLLPAGTRIDLVG